MNTIYDGIINKPDIDDVIIEHYGVKGMKWRHHKLRSKASLLVTSARRRLKGMSADQISYNNGEYSFDRHDDGKARSTSNTKGNRRYKGRLEIENNGSKLTAGIEAGRARVALDETKKARKRMNEARKIFRFK